MKKIFFIILILAAPIVFSEDVDYPTEYTGGFEPEECNCRIKMDTLRVSASGSHLNCKWGTPKTWGNPEISLTIWWTPSSVEKDYKASKESQQKDADEIKANEDSRFKVIEYVTEGRLTLIRQELPMSKDGETKFHGKKSWIDYDTYTIHITAEHYKNLDAMKADMAKVEQCVDNMLKDRFREEEEVVEKEPEEEKAEGNKPSLWSRTKFRLYIEWLRWKYLWQDLMLQHPVPPWVEEAIDEVDAENCTEFRVGFIDEDYECFAQAAIKAGNPLVCEKVPDEYEAAKCYAAISYNKKDPGICDGMYRERKAKDVRDFKDHCYHNVFSTNMNASLCEDTDRRENCLSYIVKKTGNVELCKNMGSYELICKVCAAEHGDKDFCNEIKNKWFRKNCENGNTEPVCRMLLYPNYPIGTGGSGAARG